MQIKLNNVGYYYGKQKKWGKKVPPKYVLENINLTIESGEKVAICGKSGSGKTTLLQLLKGFTRPSSGELLLEGHNPFKEKKEELFDKIGYVFQYPEHQLFAATVAEDIEFGLKQLGVPSQEREVKMLQALEDVGLPAETYRHRSPLELSGGEKRRVAIAGVLVLEPEVLILDEPTAGLDLSSRVALFELIEDLRQKRGTTIIWVSHQLEEMLNYAERMIAIHNGSIVADGKPITILTDENIRSIFGWEEPPALTIAQWIKEISGIKVLNPLNEKDIADAILHIVNTRSESTWLQEAT